MSERYEFIAGISQQITEQLEEYRFDAEVRELERGLEDGTVAPLEILARSVQRNVAAETLLEDRARELRVGLSCMFVHDGLLWLPDKQNASKNPEDCYDPALPTLGITADGFGGCEALGLAAQRRRAAGRPSINVVYLPVAQTGAYLARDRRNQPPKYYAPSGILIDEDMTTWSGKPREPFAIDILECGQPSVEAEQVLAKYRMPLLTPRHDVVETKAAGLRRLEGAKGVHLPHTRLVTHTKTAGDVLAGVQAVCTNGRIVLKPNDALQGNGVQVLAADDTETIMQHAQTMMQHGTDVLVQEFIRPLPFRDPYSGEAKDWNVRAICMAGQFLGMYARVGATEAPINYAQGADAWPMDKLLPHLGLDSKAQQQVQEELQTVATTIAARYPGSYIGIDLAVDEHLRVCVFETNAGHAGGFSTVIKLAPTQAAAEAIADAAIEALLPRVTAARQQAPPLTNVPARKRHSIPLGEEDIHDATLSMIHQGHDGLLPLAKLAMQTSERSVRQLRNQWIHFCLHAVQYGTEEDVQDVLLASLRGKDDGPYEHWWYELGLWAAGRLRALDYALPLLEEGAFAFPKNELFVSRYLTGVAAQDGIALYEHAARLWNQAPSQAVRNGIVQTLAANVDGPLQYQARRHQVHIDFLRDLLSQDQPDASQLLATVRDRASQAGLPEDEVRTALVHAEVQLVMHALSRHDVAAAWAAFGRIHAEGPVAYEEFCSTVPSCLLRVDANDAAPLAIELACHAGNHEYATMLSCLQERSQHQEALAVFMLRRLCYIAEQPTDAGARAVLERANTILDAVWTGNHAALQAVIDGLAHSDSELLDGLRFLRLAALRQAHADADLTGDPDYRRLLSGRFHIAVQVVAETEEE